MLAYFFMAIAVSLEPVINDPLLTRVPLEYTTLVYPYGFPVMVRSNSIIAMQAADVSWRTYRQRHDEQPLDIRILISETDSPACVEPPLFRSQGHLLSIVADRENFACLDLRAGFAFGWATKRTAESTEYFRQCLLDVMIYPLLEIRHLITLHAACVRFRDRGMLLAGVSGAGKSSLAYACSRRGWTYVSDDASAFRRNARIPTVIGHPHKFRFREPVGQLFPEFKDLKSTLRAYGKPTIEVQTQSIEGILTKDESEIDAIVFLNRRDHRPGPPALLPIPTEEAWKRLSFSVWSIQMPAFEERLAALESLLEISTFELRYAEFDPAIDLLEDLVENDLL